MAISLIVGVPGSGKTYYTVTEMLSEKKKILTNVPLQGKFPRKYQGFEVFEKEVFEKYIVPLYAFKDSREELLEEAKKIGFFDLALFFDECHMFLDTQKKEMLWFLTFHRHLHFNVYLVTQNKSGIVSRYRSLPEHFILVYPPSKRAIESIFKYSVHVGFAMSNRDQVRTFTQKADPKIFGYYQTGENNKGDSSARKRLVAILLLFLLVPVVFYFFIASFGRKSTTIAQEPNATQEPQSTIAQEPNATQEPQRTIAQEPQYKPLVVDMSPPPPPPPPTTEQRKYLKVEVLWDVRTEYVTIEGVTYRKSNKSVRKALDGCLSEEVESRTLFRLFVDREKIARVNRLVIFHIPKSKPKSKSKSKPKSKSKSKPKIHALDSFFISD